MVTLFFDVIPSTNLFLKENYSKYDNLTCVVANHQTNGRGRFNRQWLDSDDLLFSILIKNIDYLAPSYSLRIASSILKVFKTYGLKPLIKWPNDIIVNNKKVCGILLEAVTKEKMECLIIGVGINCNSTLFSEDLKIKASSLKNELKNDINKKELLSLIQKQFIDDLNNNDDYLTSIRDNSYLDNKKVSFVYQGQERVGIVKGYSSDGLIIIQSDNEELTISSGEITLQNIY